MLSTGNRAALCQMRYYMVVVADNHGPCYRRMGWQKYGSFVTRFWFCAPEVRVYRSALCHGGPNQLGMLLFVWLLLVYLSSYV
jgi:hypothetical protein